METTLYGASITRTVTCEKQHKGGLRRGPKRLNLPFKNAAALKMELSHPFLESIPCTFISISTQALEKSDGIILTFAIYNQFQEITLAK